MSEEIQIILGKLQFWYKGTIKLLPNIFVAIITFLVFFSISKVVSRLLMRLFDKSMKNQGMKGLVVSFAQILVIMLGVILALAVMELDKAVYSMIAGLGIAGIVLGFALKDIAANFISGFLIALRSPFMINDVIKINNILGTVEDIKIRDTTLKNFSGQTVIIPNKEFMTSEIYNYNFNGSRKLTVPIGLSYTDDLEQVKNLIMKIVGELRIVLKSPKPSSNFTEFGSSSVNLDVHFWVQYPGTDILKATDEVIINIKKALDKNNYSIPYQIIEFQNNLNENKNLAKYD